MTDAKTATTTRMAERFRGYLPVVVDIETGGFEADRHAILEIAAVTLVYEEHSLTIDGRLCWAVQPFHGAAIEASSLKITGIDLEDPKRQASDEQVVVKALFGEVRKAIKVARCHRGILVGHNAAFDAQFLRALVHRTQAKRDPFHPFSVIDTASLAAVAYGHTVLSEACQRAGIAFDPEKAHSALYDAERTAELFCKIVNAWDGGSVRGARNRS